MKEQATLFGPDPLVEMKILYGDEFAFPCINVKRIDDEDVVGWLIRLVIWGFGRGLILLIVGFFVHAAIV